MIDEAETQNIAMNSIYILKVQEAVYRLYSWFSCGKTPTFMCVSEYNESRKADGMYADRRPDLLNRIENFLISMSHSFDQHVDEQLKQMRELKEQIVIIMQQLDVLKKKLIVNENVKEFTSPVTERRLSRLIELPEFSQEEEKFVRKTCLMRNTTF